MTGPTIASLEGFAHFHRDEDLAEEGGTAVQATTTRFALVSRELYKEERLATFDTAAEAERNRFLVSSWEHCKDWPALIGIEVRQVAHDQCHEGRCAQQGQECYLPDTPIDGPPDYYYCQEHIHKNGFCWGCGLFWSGIESFDFNLWGNELCDNCKDSSDIAGDDDGEDEDFEYPDEAYMEVSA